MVKDTLYEGEREVRTHYDLSLGADMLIEKSEKEQRGSYYTIMSSLLLTAFTFEAYLNHLGSIRFAFWDEIESIKVLDKYSVLCKELKITPDFSKRPYQTLNKLFKFRNSIAHGKSKILKEKKMVNSNFYPYNTPKTDWEEYCKLNNAKKAKKDIEEIIKELHKTAGYEDYPFMNGISSSSLSLITPNE